MAPVLITGVSGFIGTHLARKLLAQGMEVHGVSRSEPGIAPPGLRWHQADLSRMEAVERVFGEAKPEVVFHLASHVTGAPGVEQIAPTFRGNVATTVNVLTEATRSSCARVVLAGSMEEPEADETVHGAGSPYAVAKWAATGYGKAFQKLFGTPVALARIFMVYGPGQWDETKLVPYVIRSLLGGEAPRLSMGGRPVDWIYVDDVVDGLAAMGSGLGPVAEPLDLGSGELVTVRSVVETIEEFMGAQGSAVFGALQDRPFEEVRKADVGRTRRALGWEARVPLNEGLRTTIDWYRGTGPAREGREK